MDDDTPTRRRVRRDGGLVGVLAFVGLAVGLRLAVPGYSCGTWARVGAGAAFLVAGVALAVLAVGVHRAVDRLQFVD